MTLYMRNLGFPPISTTSQLLAYSYQITIKLLNLYATHPIYYIEYTGQAQEMTSYNPHDASHFLPYVIHTAENLQSQVNVRLCVHTTISLSTHWNIYIRVKF
jgi:hypothetical protein